MTRNLPKLTIKSYLSRSDLRTDVRMDGHRLKCRKTSFLKTRDLNNFIKRLSLV